MVQQGLLARQLHAPPGAGPPSHALAASDGGNSGSHASLVSCSDAEDSPHAREELPLTGRPALVPSRLAHASSDAVSGVVAACAGRAARPAGVGCGARRLPPPAARGFLAQGVTAAMGPPLPPAPMTQADYELHPRSLRKEALPLASLVRCKVALALQGGRYQRCCCHLLPILLPACRSRTLRHCRRTSAAWSATSSRRAR